MRRDISEMMSKIASHDTSEYHTRMHQKKYAEATVAQPFLHWRGSLRERCPKEKRAKKLQNNSKHAIMIMLTMNSQDKSGGNSEQFDGITNLYRRGDEVIEYILT